MKITYSFATDKGNYRTKNEDFIGISIPKSRKQRKIKALVFIVADGLGGGEGGDLASEIAVKTVLELYEKDHQSDFYNIINTANDTLHEYGAKNYLKHFGTTLTILTIFKNNYAFFHVGDSRIFRIREENITQLTNDHTAKPTNEILNKSTNLISQALGITEKLDIDYGEGIINKNDYFILATDGFFEKQLNHNEVLGNIKDNSINDLSLLLIDQSKRAGSKDNISVIIINAKKTVSRILLSIVILILMAIITYGILSFF